MRSLIVKVPGTPSGEPIEVPGLGVFPNGYTGTVEDEKVEQFETLMRQTYGEEWECEYPLVIGLADLEMTPPAEQPDSPVVQDVSPGPDAAKDGE